MDVSSSKPTQGPGYLAGTLALLAGGMAVLPVLPDELPIDPEPVPPLVPDELPIEPEPELPDDPVEPDEPDGLVEEDPGVVVPELSAALLQPASANTPASASAAVVVVFSVGACISIFL